MLGEKWTLKRELRRCHDCGAAPGQPHGDNCDVERCSVCGGQYMCCGCEGHDKSFARWTGWWPGGLEADALGIDLNEFERQGWPAVLFVKSRGMGGKQ